MFSQVNNIVIVVLLTALFTINPLLGQDSLSTFIMQYDGEAVLVTQDIDSRLLGVYMQREGKRKRMFFLGKNGDESYQLIQSTDSKGISKWDPEKKETIEWGVLTYEGKLVYMQIREFADGKMKTYPGLVVIYKDLKTQTHKDILLYEVEGQLTLGGIATKVSEMVAN